MKTLLFAGMLAGGWINGIAVAEEKQSPFTVEQTPHGVAVSEAGKKVLFYQQQPKSQQGKYQRANYVHPLYDLNGQVLTEDFPADHRHHRGIFWAWHQLWVGKKKLGDAWSTKNFLAKVQEVRITQNAEPSLTLHARVHWTSNQLQNKQDEPVPVVEEQTAITAWPRQDLYRQIDFDIQLKALLPGVKIGGSEDDKGYGGFSTRIKLSPERTFRAPQGLLQPKTTAVNAGPWVDFSHAENGLAIFDHPQNPGYPQGWILRKKRSMQNPVYPGREPHPLSQDKPLRLKYRLVIHSGKLPREELNRLHQEWSAASPPK